jgi:hypothetical protein
MFEQELSSLLNVTAYVEDQELREELEESIKSTVRSLVYSREQRKRESEQNAARLCRFNEAWRGRCNKPSVNDAGTLCADHIDVWCRARGCKNHAVETCAETYQFVCGAPVCKKHHRCNRGSHS